MKNKKRILTGILTFLLVCSTLSEPGITVWAADTESKAKSNTEIDSDELPELTETLNLPNKEDEGELESPADTLEEIPDMPADTEGLTNMYEDGEGVFLSIVPAAMQKARAATIANLVVGDAIPYPTNLGNYSTNYFTVNGRVAYCLESAKATPPASGYVANEFEDNELLQKVLYYGYGGPEDVTDIYMPTFDAQLKYLFTHLAAAYAYCGIDGFAGCTMADIEACGVWGFVSYLNNLETPPSTSIDVSPIRPIVYAQGEIQRTPEFRLIGDHRSSVLISLPKDVTCHYGGAEVTGSVEVFGGTSFYFSAPWNMTGTWFSGVMKNRLGQQWKAMVLSTGDGNQDVGYGEFSDGPNDSVQLIVDWLNLTKIGVFKRDKKISSEPLPGALFKIYSDAECTNLIGEMPLTDEDGNTAVILPNKWDKVYLKEIDAPLGYRLNTKVYEVTPETGKFKVVTFTNVEQTGKITIQKQGEALTGVDGEEGSLQFRYELLPYSGAGYTIYAAEDIYSQDKVTKLYDAGEVMEVLETGADGSVLSKELYLGKYRVVEDKAPYGLVYGTTEEQRTKDVTLSYAGQDIEFAQGMAVFTNDRPEVSVKAVKKSENSGITLEGAVFGLYTDSDITAQDGTILVASGTLIEQAVSDADGNACFQSDIPIGYQYSVREIQAPENYYQSDENFTFTYGYQDDRTYTYTFEQEFQNEEVRGEIHIKKTDKDSQAFLSQGDAQLAGAAYGLYAAEDIEAPDKKSGIIFQKGELVAQGRISNAGTLDFTDLYLGEYVVEEMEAPEGYLLDETEYPVSLAYEGQEVKTVRKNVTVGETVKKQAFQILKISEDGEQTETDPVEGAGFKIFLISSLTGVQDGSTKPGNGNLFTAGDFIGYNFNGEETASYYVDGKKVNVPELFTDTDGYLKSPELPYGDYVVIESTVPENLHPVNPFLVHISEDSRKPQAWRVLDDRPFQFLLKIVKKDAQTQAEVVDNSAAYKIFDVEAEEYVEMPVRYPNKEMVSVFKTNEEGFLVTPGFLGSGTYQIEEVEAPENYVQQGFENTFTSDGRDVPLNEVTGDGGYQEAGAGPILLSVNSDTAYQVEEETGTFTVLVEQSNNAAVGSLTLHKKGERLKEAVNIQDGFVNRIKNGVASVVNQVSGLLTGEDVMEEVSGYDFTYEEIGLEGVEFSVYANDTIYTPDGQADPDGNRSVRYEKDALVASIVTDADGTAVLNNLPVGSYYVVEEKTIENHVLDQERKEFEVTYKGQETAVDYVEMELANERQRVSLEMLKKDSITGEPIEGVVFGLYAGEDVFDAEGQEIVGKDALIETGKTDAAGKLVFQSDLPHGLYYAKELEKKAGYLDSEEIYFFEAGYTKPTEKVLRLSCEAVNEPTVTEFTKTDTTDGQEIEGATLQILKNGEVVEEWVSGKEPHTVYALEPGEYLLHESAAPAGYVAAEDVKFTVRETGEIQKVEMQDKRTMGRLRLKKMDSGNGEPLEGVEFTLYEKSTGKEAAVLVTDREGKAESELLPIGSYEDGTFTEPIPYVLKETKAKEGYKEPEEEWEILFEYRNDQIAVSEVWRDIWNTKEKEPEREPGKETDTEKDSSKPDKSQDIREADGVRSETAPQTGDSINGLIPLLGLLSGGGCVLWIVIWVRKKRRRG